MPRRPTRLSEQENVFSLLKDVFSVHDPRYDVHDVVMASAATGRAMRAHLHFVKGLFDGRKMFRPVDDFFDIRDGYVHAMAYGFVFRHTDPILLSLLCTIIIKYRVGIVNFEFLLYNKIILKNTDKGGIKK